MLEREAYFQQIPPPSIILNVQSVMWPFPPIYCLVIPGKKSWLTFTSTLEAMPKLMIRFEGYLLSNSGATLGVKKDGSDLRITQTLWFNRMHGKSKRYFDNSSVGSGSNCAVCHSHATDGRFDENKIPANTDWQLQLNPFGLNRKPNTK